MTSPDDPAHAMLAPALLELGAAVKQAAARVGEGGARRGATSSTQDDEAVHDFRVALRRLRTLLRPARRVYGEKRARAVDDDLRTFAQATGALRDEEVLRETLGALELPPPFKEELAAWIARRRRQEQARRAQVRNLLRGPALDAALARLDELLRPGHARHRATDKLARRALKEAKRGVRRRASADPEDTSGMHDLRIRYKRLRYTVELFAPILGPGAEEIEKRAARMQRRLGELHDLDEAIVRIKRARGLHDVTRAAVHEALREARAASIHRIRHEHTEALLALESDVGPTPRP